MPEIASRKHLEAIDLCISQALLEAGTDLKEVDAVAVTYGPGLVGALLVGVAEAKALAYAAGKPLIGVNHIRGHIAANYITNPDWEPPYLCLIVSGGHTHLVLVKDYTEFEILGKTRDDAAGEAFDKVKEGNPEAIHFPRPCLDEEGYSFSFSGLKSAVLNYLNQLDMKGETYVQADVAASFQQSIVDVLVTKTMQAAKEFGMKKIALAGGVSANSAIRAGFEKACKKHGYELNIPELVYCTDNAAMIGCAGYYQYLQKDFADLSLNAVPNDGLK